MADAPAVVIRAEHPEDLAAVDDIVTAAFGRRDEADLVARLRADGDVVIALVSITDERLVGHLLFSRLRIHTVDRVQEATALAPVAVLPDYQRQGFGSALIREGLSVLRLRGERLVVVLGDPAFYGRFGFSAALARGLIAPFSGPAFMAMGLVPQSGAGITGRVEYPSAFGL